MSAGDLPTVAGVDEEREACVTGFFDTCSSPFNIKIRKCNGFHVYQLLPTASCYAYCFGKEKLITSKQNTVAVLFL